MSISQQNTFVLQKQINMQCPGNLATGGINNCEALMLKQKWGGSFEKKNVKETNIYKRFCYSYTPGMAEQTRLGTQ